MTNLFIYGVSHRILCCVGSSYELIEPKPYRTLKKNAVAVRSVVCWKGENNESKYIESIEEMRTSLLQKREDSEIQGYCHNYIICGILV